MKKQVLLTFRKKTITFEFDIKKNSYGTYDIVILKTPKPLERYGCHSAHYLPYGYSSKKICWSEDIRSYKDANAIMFQWARNFRDNCMRNDSTPEPRVTTSRPSLLARLLGL